MLDRARHFSQAQKAIMAVTAVLLAGCILCCGCASLVALFRSGENKEFVSLASNEEVSGELATVIRIIDGDTIEVEINGHTYRVRYIGMDTPERGEPFFDEATEANRRLVDGQSVTLVKDVSETDRYGRLLRYVYLADGIFVNAELVRQGYAQVATFPPDVAHQELFVQMQQEARDAGHGLWGLQDGARVPRPVYTPQSTYSPSDNCDPAYPTVCIPSPPPNLNCGSIPYDDFEVLEPDPHGFDGDNDGWGCES